MVVDYDPGASFFITALKWSNTVVPHVLARKEFWFLFLIHLVVGHLWREGYLEGGEQKGDLLYINWDFMKIISSITTFFEVFYTNQTFGRYWHLYAKMRAMLRNALEFGFETTLHLQGDGPHQHVRLATRYFLCSLMLFLFEMAHKENVDKEREWDALITSRLLSPDERTFLEDVDKNQRSLVMLHWAAKVTREGFTEAQAPPNTLKTMIDKLVETRDLQQEVADTMHMPIPFQYFHLLNVMIIVNLLLWAYGMGLTDSVFAPVTYFFASLIFMGMMELAAQLSDPFGQDDTDFPVSHWLTDSLRHISVVLEHENPFESDKWKKVLEEETALNPDFGSLDAME